MERYHNNQTCIEACLRCAAICNYCSSSCTQSEHVHMMARCIQLTMECAAICYATGQLLSLGSERALELCRLCAEACEACANECAQHESEHCQVCARTCRICAEECLEMAGSLTKSSESFLMETGVR